MLGTRGMTRADQDRNMIYCYVRTLDLDLKIRHAGSFGCLRFSALAYSPTVINSLPKLQLKLSRVLSCPL